MPTRLRRVRQLWSRRDVAWRCGLALGPAALVAWLLTSYSGRWVPWTIATGSAFGAGLLIALADAWLKVKVSACERPRALVALWSAGSVLVLLVGAAAPQLRYALNPLWAAISAACLLFAILLEFSWWRQIVLGLIAMGAWISYELRLSPTEAALGAALAAVPVTASRGGPGLRAWPWLSALPVALAALAGADGGGPPFQCAHQGPYDPWVEFNDAEWWRHREFVFAFRASGALSLGGIAVAIVSRRRRHLRPSLLRTQSWFRDALPAPALLGVFVLLTCSEDATAATYAERSAEWVPAVRLPVVDSQLDYPEYLESHWPAIIIAPGGGSGRYEIISVAGRIWLGGTPVATAPEAAQWARRQIHERSSEHFPPFGAVLAVEPDVPLPSVLHVAEELRAAGVERISLAYVAPLPEPLAPPLLTLRPRLRHQVLWLLAVDELDCDAPVVSVESLSAGGTSSSTPWSRVFVLGGPDQLLLITSHSNLSYGEFLERLLTGRDDDPARTALVLAPRDWPAACRGREAKPQPRRIDAP